MSLVSDKKIYTSEEGEKILELIRDFTGLDYSVISKIAISLSILMSDELKEMETDNNGKNLRGINIFGDDDILFYSILCMSEKRKLTPTEFFSSKSISKDRLERGLKLLKDLYEESNYDKLIFFNKLVSKVKILNEFEERIKSNQLKIKIGKDIQTQEDVWLELNNTSLHPNPHLAVMGKSGVGKTQFLFHILSEIRSISNYEVNVIFFDYKGDVASNENFINKGKLKVFSLPKDMIPINPFQLDSYEDNDIRRSAREKAETFSSISKKGFGDVQKNTLTDLIISAYEKRKFSEKKFPDFNELFEITNEYYSDKKHDTLFAIIEDLSQYHLFWNHKTETKPFESILSESFIVDLSKLTLLKELVAYLIIESIYKEMSFLPDSQIEGNYRQIRTILVIDEAHNYLRQKNIFLEKLIREGRSKGVAVFLASQSPKDFVSSKMDLKEHLEFLYTFQSDNLDISSVRALLRINTKKANQVITNISRFKPFQCITRDKLEDFKSFGVVKFYEIGN